MKPYVQDADFTLLNCDVLEGLASLEDESVHCVVTSPPYFALRDYGTGRWEGGSADCDHIEKRTRNDAGRPATEVPRGKGGAMVPSGYSEPVPVAMQFARGCGKCGARRVDQQLGLEATPEAYVARMVDVFREVRRVLRADGTCWLNIGDSYAGAWGNQGRKDERGTQRPINGPMLQPLDTRYPHKESNTGAVPAGLKPKDLCGIPWRLAFALQADGWYLRSDIIWAKPNPMPESVTDRPTKAHEYVFLLTKSPRYYWDAEAVREPHKEPWRGNGEVERNNWSVGGTEESRGSKDTVRQYNPAGRNVRSVWEIATQPYPDAHFACVDAETEALTPTGWQPHYRLRDGDLIAAYDPESDGCRFEAATFLRYDYAGELVVIEKRDSSQRLTPNHRCFVRRRSGWTGIVEAADLKPGMEILTAAPLTVTEIEGIGLARAALLGWYTAEGWNTDGQQVGISQSERANPQHCATIRSLLDKVGATYREKRRDRNGGEFEWYVSGEVALWLRACGKRLDPASACLPESEAQALLDALIDGDGHRRADGRTCIIQKDRRSIEAMQMLALRLGYRAALSQRKEGGYALYLTRGRWLTLRGTNGTHKPIGRETYEGVVWCPSVSTGLWLARRDGKPFVTGNTFPEELVRRCILAGSSERGCCPVCGKPWEREVERMPVSASVGETQGRYSHDPAILSASTRGIGKSRQHYRSLGMEGPPPPQTLGWRPGCECKINMGGHETVFTRPQVGTSMSGIPMMVPPPTPCVVLDPFLGSGTTSFVARKHGRRSIGIELSADYCKLAARRMQQQSLFSEVAGG